MSEPTYEYLTLDSRMYEYIRTTAITNINDALVELITNSVDAYTGITNNPNKIRINYNKTNKTIKVTDYAIGLTGTAMEQNFLTVGSYTSDYYKRGHFSRGAKDISAIGHITFETIKDNKFSSVKIKDTGMGAVLAKDIDATQEHRDRLGFVDETVNGLSVTVELTKVSVDNWRTIYFRRHYALRDIMSNSAYEVTFIDEDLATQQVVTYGHPNGKLGVEVTWKVPKYNVNATLKVYVDETGKLYHAKDRRYTENGFLISSTNAVYENSLLNDNTIAGHPQIKKVFGRISCEHINHLLKDFESNGYSTLNPFPIIDNSRTTGLNQKHPFVKQLMILPQERVRAVLTELDYQAKNVNTNDINDLFKSLNNVQLLGNEIFSKLDIELNSTFLLDHNYRFKQKSISENQNLPYSSNSLKSSTKKQNLKEASQLQFNFVDTAMDAKFESYVNNSGIVINVPTYHSAIKRYITTDDNATNGINDTRAKVAMADIITEAFSEILATKDVEDSDLSGKEESIEYYNKQYDAYYRIYEEKVYSAMLD